VIPLVSIQVSSSFVEVVAKGFAARGGALLRARGELLVYAGVGKCGSAVLSWNRPCAYPHCAFIEPHCLFPRADVFAKAPLDAHPNFGRVNLQTLLRPRR